MLPRQPSNVPMIEPTTRPATSATRTLAELSATARRRSSAVSVAVGVDPAFRHSSRPASTCSNPQSRTERPFTVSFIVASGQNKQSAAATVCHGPLFVSTSFAAKRRRGRLRHSCFRQESSGHRVRKPDPIDGNEELEALAVHLPGRRLDNYRLSTPPTHLPCRLRVLGEMDVVPFALLQPFGHDRRQKGLHRTGIQTLRALSLFPFQANFI